MLLPLRLPSLPHPPLRLLRPLLPLRPPLRYPPAETVNSPMPGTIVSVNVSAGQNVKKGDVLVVLEAMKMENEIMAPRDAVVASVQVNKGDSVDSGTPLVSLQ